MKWNIVKAIFFLIKKLDIVLHLKSGDSVFSLFLWKSKWLQRTNASLSLCWMPLSHGLHINIFIYMMDPFLFHVSIYPSFLCFHVGAFRCLLMLFVPPPPHPSSPQCWPLAQMKQPHLALMSAVTDRLFIGHWLGNVACWHSELHKYLDLLFI